MLIHLRIIQGLIWWNRSDTLNSIRIRHRNRKINRLRRIRCELLNIPLISRFLQQAHNSINPLLDLILISSLILSEHSLYLGNILLGLFYLMHRLQYYLIPCKIGEQGLPSSFYSKIDKWFLIQREKLGMVFLYRWDITTGVSLDGLVARSD